MRKLALFTGGFAAVTLAFVYGLLQELLLVIPAAILLAGLCLCLSGAARRRALAILLGAAFAAAWCAGFTAVCVRPAEKLAGQAVDFSAHLQEYPTQTRYGSAMQVRLTADGKSFGATLYLSDPASELAPGDTVCGTARLRLTEDSYARSHGMFLVASAEEGYRVEHPARVSLSAIPAWFSQRVKENLRRAFPADAAGFFLALCTGDRSEMDFSFKNDLSLAGIYHAVSLSGMHAAILLGIILFLCGNRRGIAAAAGIPLVIFFTLMTGASPSMSRAAVMMVLLLLAPLARRDYDPPTALAAALLLLLLPNPYAVTDWGLQLSFLSVAGILLFASPLSQRILASKAARAAARHPLMERTLRFFVVQFSVSAAALCLTIPLSAAYFGYISLVAIPVNLLCLWLVTILFAGGLAVAAASFMFAPAAGAMGWLLAWPLRLIRTVVGFFGGLPFAAIYGDRPILMLWLIFAMAGVVFILLARPRWRVAAVCGGVTLAVSLLFTFLPADAGVSFTALDVGQGQCLLLRSGANAAVVDCGASGDETGEKAARYLISRGVERVEDLVLTHFDADHCDGVCRLLARLPVENLYIPPSEDGALRRAILETAEKRGTRVQTITEDRRFTAGCGEMTVFAPVADGSDNESGLSVLLSADGLDILVTGDMTAECEARLLAAHPLVGVEAMVAGHHGSKKSTSAETLAALHPQVVAVSVGENSYGHPAAEVLSRIRAAGAAVCRTDTAGSITIRR